MQNSPPDSGEPLKGFGAQKPFSFTNVTSSPIITGQDQPTFQNAFMKSNIHSNKLFGMNINPSPTPNMFGGLPKSLSSTSAPFSAKSPPASFFSRPALPIVRESVLQKDISGLSPLNPTPELPKEEIAATPDLTNKTSETSDSPKVSPLKKSSSVNVSQLRAIVVFDIPEDSNNKLELTKHFQPFGNIIRIFPNLNKNSATIHFDSHDAAAKAKKNGTKLRPNVELKILWKQSALKEKKTNLKTSAIKPEKHESSTPESDVIEVKKLAGAAKKIGTSTFNLSDGLPMHISIEELESILVRHTNGVAERSTILDARDRYIRLKREAKTTTVKSAVIKGTCYDMCPEKERYSRAEKRRLASYEILAGCDKDYEVDHRLAVKEYSRSSADQAEPLAHELRPLPVLQMTTDYLMSTIVDRCDRPGENLADWFNFLWDRTRGIRKDVTQQSLCEPKAVDLIEKFARFHIHCTSRLCELDMQDFDQKINDENLTKCLQTLKHMYYDLSVKDIYCENEAEFRAYDILLHLNGGDILRELQQLRTEVHESLQVKGALQFFYALNSRNYVRFFNLAKKNTNYLQCCLLQRYFYQIRSSALQIMVHAYGPPKKGQIQLNNIINILGFEDKEEAVAWCQCHNLPVDEDSETISLERTNFIEMPEKFPNKRRSFRLIENKRTCPVSQIISNGKVPLDQTYNHQPHNSFDQNGVLFRHSWLAEDQAIEQVVSYEPSQKPFALKPSVVEPFAVAEQPNLGVSSFVKEMVSNNIFNLVIDSTIKELISLSVQEIQRELKILKLTKVYYETFISDFTREMCSESVRDVVVELQVARRRQQQETMELQRKIALFSSKLFGGIIESIINDELTRIGKEEIQSAARLKLEALRAALTSQLLDSVLKEVVQSETRLVSIDVAEDAVDKREKLVERVKCMVSDRRLRCCFNRWVRFTVTSRNRRLEKQTFPACPSRLLLQDQAAMLKSKGERAVSSVKRKSIIEQVANVKKVLLLSDYQFSIHKLQSVLNDFEVNLLSTLNVPLRRYLNKSKHHCWKLVILSLNCDEAGELLRKWFGLHSVTKSSDGWVFVETDSVPSPLTLCIRFITMPNHIGKCLNGADALLVIYDPETETRTSFQNLASLLSNEFEYNPVTVATVASKSESSEVNPPTEILASCQHFSIDFKQPQRDGHLEMVKIFESFIDCGHSKPSPDFQNFNFGEFAQNFIYDKIVTPIFHNLEQRMNYGLLHQPLRILVEFYNCGVNHLVDVIGDPMIRTVKWPAPELVDIVKSLPPINWNTLAHQKNLISMASRFLPLPDWTEEPKSFAEACIALGNYCSSVKLPGTDTAGFLSRVNSILENCQARFQAVLSNGVPQVENIPWTEIFLACIKYRLQVLTERSGSMHVGYFPHILQNFQMNDSWIQANSWLALSEAKSLDDTLQTSRTELETKQKLEAMTKEGNDAGACQLSDLPLHIAQLRDVIIETSLQSRLENEHFEALFQRVPTAAAMPLEMSRNSSLRSSITTLSSDDPIENVNRIIQQLRREEHDFESYVQRELLDL